MIISKCPKEHIQAAAAKVGVRISYCDALSRTGLRHKVKLAPSLEKPYKVEAGERLRHSAPLSLRMQYRAAYNELGIGTPEEFVTLSPEDIGEVLWLQARKLKWLILGRFYPKFKYIARYQRKGICNRERACAAVCWHGFRDFFRELYRLSPNAYIKTGLALYRNSESFEKVFPGTAFRNIGSTYSPLQISDACWCGQEVTMDVVGDCPRQLSQGNGAVRD